MYEIIQNGGLGNGGLNFDAKNRRSSNSYDDMFKGFILGMDAYALGLIKAAALIEDGRIKDNLTARYSGYETGIGAQIKNSEIGLVELAAYADEKGSPKLPESGNQEGLQSIVNQVLFGN
jgi:xylose isomerase